MKTFFYTACGLVAYVGVIFTVSSVSSAFNQRDTLLKVNEKAVFDSVKTVLQDKPVVELEKISEQKLLERGLIKDSIAQNVEEWGNLKMKAQPIKQTLKSTESNLIETIIRSDDKPLQPIIKEYRIDTSPRAVVIHVMFPDFKDPKPRRKGWIFRRD